MSEYISGPISLDSDFDIIDANGVLLAMQGSCVSRESMREIVRRVNGHNDLIEALLVLTHEDANEDDKNEARTLLAALKAEKGGEL